MNWFGWFGLPGTGGKTNKKVDLLIEGKKVKPSNSGNIAKEKERRAKKAQKRK